MDATRELQVGISADCARKARVETAIVRASPLQTQRAMFDQHTPGT